MRSQTGQMALDIHANTKDLAGALQRASESNARYYKRTHGHKPFKPGTQPDRVHGAMMGDDWATLAAIASKSGVPLSTVGSRIRDLRKRRGHEHIIHVEPIREGSNLYIYKMEEKNEHV